MAKVAKDGIAYEVRSVQLDAFLNAGWTVVEESAAAEEPVAEAEAPVEEKPKPKRRTTKKA